VLIDHTNVQVLDVLETRDKESLVKYLRENKQRHFSQLEEMTCDMWDA
jgi:transposase